MATPLQAQDRSLLKGSRLSVTSSLQTVARSDLLDIFAILFLLWHFYVFSCGLHKQTSPHRSPARNTPGKIKSKHLIEPKRTWQRLLIQAGITDLRIDDRRRTLGSCMAMNNQTLQNIGIALNHKSTPVTQINSRRPDDPVRRAMEQAQTDMLAAAGLLYSTDNVIAREQAAAKKYRA